MRKLVVKSANGSVEDFKIDAQLNWTVKEIKAHIYRLYPTHPPVPCQKLIYGGKLLLDQSTLSEAIPVLEEHEPTVIHLVVYERSRSVPSTTSVTGATSERVHSNASNSEGVRNRQETGGSNRQPAVGTGERANGPQQPSQRVPVNPWLHHRRPMLPNQMPAMFPPNAMQHFPPNLQNVAGGVANPFLQAPPFYQSPYGAMYANQLQQWYNNYYRVPMGGGIGGHVARDNQPPLDLPVNEPADLPEPQDDDQEDIPVNGPGGLMMAGGAAPPGMRHRDLVDYLYMFSMISFLVLMAFLTGSLGRLLIFAAGIIFMILNQAGFFSLQRRRQAPLNPNFPGPQGQEGNPGPPNQEGGNLEEEGEVEREREVEDREGEEGEDGDGDQDAPRPSGRANTPPLPDDQSPPHGQATEEQQQLHPGVFATVFTFITSFFTSLVPQQRPELQVGA